MRAAILPPVGGKQMTYTEILKIAISEGKITRWQAVRWLKLNGVRDDKAWELV
jgi:hypothetical protein